MSPERLDHLVSLVGHLIAKKACKSRIPISAEERLVITLRYLATGDSQLSQAFNSRVGRSTVCHIISDTCDGIWAALNEIYLRAPESKEEWTSIAREFEAKWNFQHCLGAVDGKHVAMARRQSVDTCCQTDVPITIQTPNLASWQSAAQHSF